LASRIPDSIRKKHEKEFERLRHGSKADLVRPLLFTVIFLVAVFLCVTALQNYTVRTDQIQSARVALLSEGAVWGEDFLYSQRTYRDWLIRRGTLSEVELFEKISQILFGSAASFGSEGGSGFFSRTYLAAHFGVLRIGFFLIASWRLWAFAILLALLRAALSSEVHLKNDILGQTGNGRLFFSGIRADLDKTSPGGAPELQVAGLACPQQVSRSTVTGSQLAKILANHSASNETNLALLGVILAHKKWPAYVALQEEDQLLANFMDVPSLTDNVEILLEELFYLQEAYREHFANDESAEEKIEIEVLETPEGEKVNKESFRGLLRANLDRSLTHSMKEHISQIESRELATVILAVEAGKALAFGFEGGRWARRSNFPQLSARAVLHSLPAFASDYDFDKRTVIRRAIIYAARASHFGPIRMPVNLSDKSRALRQWVELLMVSPHELQAAADEVQLFGLLGDAHKAWIEHFFDGIITLDPDILTNIYVNQGNLLFVPLKVLLKLVRKSVSRDKLATLANLVPLVSQKQKLDALSQNFSSSESGEVHESSKVPAFQKVFTPLSHSEVKSLSKEHDLSEEDVKDWSHVRVILNNYGWLGRRVGDYSVPESSLIFAILKLDEQHSEANELGLVSRPAMVALRGSKLKEKWGPSWHTRFVSVKSVSMAETKEEASKALKGLDPRAEKTDAAEVAVG